MNSRLLGTGLFSLLALSTASVRAQDDAAVADKAKAAYEILEKRCHSCHGVERNGSEKFEILNRDSLTFAPDDGSNPYVTPGNLKASAIWLRIAADPESGLLMPLGSTPLPDAEKQAIREWIEAGAPQHQVAAQERPFITERETLEAIDSDLRKILPQQDRQFHRYFSLVHLHNDRSVSDRMLRIHRAALSKALNSMSRKGKIIVPVAVDADPGQHKTLYRINVKDFGWDVLNDWKKVVEVYPYGLKPAQNPEAATAANIEQQMGVRGDGFPYMRADWFVTTALRPPLYHDLVEIPETMEALDQKLGVNRQQDFLNRQLLRAGVVKSGVSAQNRLVDRHDTGTGGSAWYSYDFRKGAAKSNLTRFPLGPLFENNPFKEQAFEHAGSEIIYRLPNGLHGYMLIENTTGADNKSSGKRIDKGPVDIVWDKKETSGTPEIVNGLSCMACHIKGLIPFEDDIAEGLAVFGNDEVQALALFGGNSDAIRKRKLSRELEADTQDYLRNLDRAIGDMLRGPDEQSIPFEQLISEKYADPVGVVARYYDRDLDMPRVAIELGMKNDGDNINIGNNRALIKLGLGPLGNNGTIKRSMWDSKEPDGSPFQRAALELNLGIPQ